MMELLMSGVTNFVETRSTSGLLFDTDEEVSIYQTLNEPVSAQDILNDWPRVDNVTYYANKDDAPAGSVSNWYYDEVRDSFVQPDNTATMVAIISPNKLTEYTFETILTSTNRDDDLIGVVVAADLIDGEYNGLYLQVNAGGGSWLGDYRFGLSFFDKDVPALRTGITVAGNNLLPSHANSAGDGWSGKTVKVRVSRSGNMVSAKCSMWNSDEILDETELIYNMNDLPRNGSRLSGPARYGFCTLSQKGATYLDYRIQSAEYSSDDKVYSIGSNGKWVYVGDSWTKSSDAASDDFEGYDRITNNITGDVYSLVDGEFSYLRTTGIEVINPPIQISTGVGNEILLTKEDVNNLLEYDNKELDILGIFGQQGVVASLSGNDVLVVGDVGSFYIYVTSPSDIDVDTGIDRKKIRFVKVEVV